MKGAYAGRAAEVRLLPSWSSAKAWLRGAAIALLAMHLDTSERYAQNTYFRDDWPAALEDWA